MKTNNTVAGWHIRKIRENNVIELSTNKLYHWNIPKRLRENVIKKGDIVMVDTVNGKTLALVMDSFREEFAETKKEYRKVLAIKQQTTE
jgi:hypothetical protein